MSNDGILVDASALIYLAKADAFQEAYISVGSMIVPPAVWREAVDAGIAKGIADPESIIGAREGKWLQRATGSPDIERASRELAERYRIGEGESQVLAMARGGARVLLDDIRATRVAAALGYVPVPTVFIPVIGVRERGLPRSTAIDMLHRLAVVVTLSAAHLARLEALMEESS